MNKIINKTFLKGSVDAITSKSAAHRVMICAAAADKKTVVFGLNRSADVEATRRCLTSLGAEFRDISGGGCEITPIFFGKDCGRVDFGCGAAFGNTSAQSGRVEAKNLKAEFLVGQKSFPLSDLRIKDGTEDLFSGCKTEMPKFGGNSSRSRNAVKILDCGESGSTLRFLLPFVAALGFDAEFHMSGRLSERPTDELTDVMEKNGVKISKNGRVLKTFGRLKNGIFELGGKVSSQFTSGLLMALPLVEGMSVVKDGDAPESTGYVDITLGILQKFMKNAPYRDEEKGGYTVNGRDLEYYANENAAKEEFCGGGLRNTMRKYSSPEIITIEGDWSNAAFFIVAGVLNGDIILNGLNLDSKQPDREIVDIIRRMGGDITNENGEKINNVDREKCGMIRQTGGDITNENGEKIYNINREKDCIIRQMGGDITDEKEKKSGETNAEIRGIRVKKSALRGVEIDAKNIPDIIPVISVAAGAAVGRTTIYNAGRLRIKECDRLEATAEMLTRLGVKVKIDGDTLTIDGNGGLFGGEGSGEASITDGKGGLFSEEKSGEVSTTDGNCGVFSGERSGESASIIDGKAVGNKIILDGYNDHRMVMSSSVAAFACGVPVEIKGAEAVNKSYPNFFEDLEKLTI